MEPPDTPASEGKLIRDGAVLIFPGVGRHGSAVFLRGMTGPVTPREAGWGHGVFFDRPPETVIERLSRLLGAPGAAP